MRQELLGPFKVDGNQTRGAWPWSQKFILVGGNGPTQHGPSVSITGKDMRGDIMINIFSLTCPASEARRQT